MARASINLILKMSFFMGILQKRFVWSNFPSLLLRGRLVEFVISKNHYMAYKQSPRVWFGKFSEVIEKFSMQKSKSDHSVFYENSQAGIILLVVYVDDTIIIGDDMASISSLKSFLHGQFHTKDLGMLKYFLGIEVMRSKHRIFLSQRKYVLDLLSETGKLAIKSC